MTRTHTPPRRNADGSETYTVQRACNGCGRGIGDVTANELDAAIDGATLPDVRDECGCSNPVVQAIAKAMCNVDHDWDFPCRNCTAAAVPLVAEARQQALHDVAVLFARNRDVWIDTRRSHPEQWDEYAEYAYAEGARVLAAWADDPSRMDGPLKAARTAAGAS
jgi:hypothetical protein